MKILTNKLATVTATTLIAMTAIPNSAIAEYVPIDFSADANALLQSRSLFTDGGIGLPTEFLGDVILGDVPFSIPETGFNGWNTYLLSLTNPNPLTLDINVGVFGVTEVHTLIDTFWGEPGPTSYASIEFFGSDTAYFKKDFIGNVDFRDFNQERWTNTINGTTTTNVASWHIIPPVGQRLDKQELLLPVDFHDQELTQIRLTDNGASRLQRVFLAGVTVKTNETTSVPEPFSILGTGIATLFGFLGLSNRKRNNKKI